MVSTPAPDAEMPQQTTPMSPTEIDELLKPDLRTLNADLLALRDGLDRMTSALWRLAAALGAHVPAEGARGRE